MKKLLFLIGLLWSAIASAQFASNQILTASALNSQFALYATLSGATYTGPVSIPTLTVTSGYTMPAGTLTGAPTIQYDFARVNLFPASNTNLNRWRLISNANGSSAGTLVFQTTTDGFASSFITPITMNTNGSVALGTTGTTSTVAGSLSVAGTGAMPLYGTTGTGVNAPHMVQGTVTLASGAATVTLSGSAVFTSSSSYVCNANDTTAANPVKVALSSGTSIALTGTGTDVVMFHCVGN